MVASKFAFVNRRRGRGQSTTSLATSTLSRARSRPRITEADRSVTTILLPEEY